MPNYCFNSLIMSETTLPVIVNNYVRKDERIGEIFDFEKIAPVGDIDDVDECYEQRMKKWGNKWVGVDLIVGETKLDFCTAWVPPKPIIIKLAELHKDIEFRLEYNEPGENFRGYITARWENGEVLVEEKFWEMTFDDHVELGYNYTDEEEYEEEEDVEEEGK